MVKVEPDWSQELPRTLTGLPYCAEVVHTEYGGYGQILDGRNNLGWRYCLREGGFQICFGPPIHRWCGGSATQTERKEHQKRQESPFAHLFVYLERVWEIGGNRWKALLTFEIDGKPIAECPRGEDPSPKVSVLPLFAYPLSFFGPQT